MGKIIGESFDPYVDLQVKTRQKKLGQTNRDNELLTYLTSKNSWLRLVSSVNIDESKATEIGTNQIGSLLAKNNILQGGVLRTTSDRSPRGGIVEAYGNDPTQAYGFNSTAEFGLIPIPSVESFEITPKNNGSLTQAKVKVKCFSKQQFKILETLYLRLGYHLLLEWGHSVYFTNDGTLQSNPIHSDALDYMFKDGIEVGELNFIIQGEREASNGNYDGMIGRVTNFDWNVTADGHYEAVISITSTGDVVESLVISKPLPTKLTEESSPDDSEDDEEKTSDAIDKTPLGKILDYIKRCLYRPYLSAPFYLGIQGSRTNVDWSPTTNYTVFGKEALTNDRIKRLVQLNDVTPYNSRFSLADREIVYINGEGFSSDWDFYYIKLGALLRIIQNFLLVYNKEPGNDTPKEPITFIDHSYGDRYNKCYLPYPIFSVDPRVCAIPSKIKVERKGKFIDLKTLNNALGTDFYDSKDDFVYNFMHIHMNIDFVRQCLIDSINNEGDILLLDLITKLCDGINTSLCNYVQLEPFHDKDDNTLYIVNKSNSDKLLKDAPPPTRFRVGLLPQGESSFVREVSISSTIPADFATQIAIGAQANDTENSSNSTPFSNWNKGLEDRIFKEKKTAANAVDTTKTDAERKKQEEERFEELTRAVADTVHYYSDFDIDDDLFELEIAVKDFFKLKLNEIEKEGKAITPIIIPISLNLTIDGLSGIKIFQKYTITEDFLPDNYQNAVEFIVKGISHTIDNGGWVTKIEGQCIPKIQDSVIFGKAVDPVLPSSESYQSKPFPPTKNTPNANALRLVLNKLGYREKGEEISNGGDISLQLASYSISVFTEIKTQFPNLQLTVTGGNDKYHQKLSYNSAHKRGDGLDFVISPSDPITLQKVDLLLQGFAAGNRSPAVSFINEYDNPTKAASGKHFHIRIGRDKSGYDKIQNAYALADRGQLTTYTIA